VRALLAAGANPWLPAAGGDAVSIAAGQGSGSLVDLLLKASARGATDVYARRVELFHAAAARGDTRVAKVFVANGTPVDVTGPPYDLTALGLAAGNGHLETTLALLDLGARPSRGALVAAARHGYPEVVRALLARGAAVSNDATEGSPLIGVLVPETLRLLLEAGAEVDSRNAAGDTALLAACAPPPGPAASTGAAPGRFALDRLGAVRLLLHAGASPASVDARGRTALLRSAPRGGFPDMPLMELLLDSGADVNARDGRGRTALFYVASREGPDRTGIGPSGFISAVHLLLDRGADPTIRDVDGRTALDLVRLNRDRSAADIERVLLGAVAARR
jgi:ankyrin repeat protein